MAIRPKFAFEISKIVEILKIAKISKVSLRLESFFHRIIFVLDFENDVRFDKNYAI